ncbi:MAG TPA: MFS transporter [Ramlibacter sp.]|nr:MFS transporter [Ramlibacter sp.]
MAAIQLGMVVSVMDASIINLALPDITRDFGAASADAAWIVNAGQLATLGLLLPCAHLSERLGFRRVYQAGVVIFILGALCCVFAPSLAWLAAARALQGIGSAGMMAVNPALVRLIFPGSGLGRALALNSVVVATSSVAGPSVAAVILSLASWPWLFIAQLPLAVLVALLGRRLPTNPPRDGAALSPLDVVLNMAMFGLLFLGADVLGARSGRAADAAQWAGAAALLAAGLMVAVFYLRRQRRLADPLFPVDLLRIPVFGLSMCASITAFAAQSLTFICLPFLLLQAQGRSHMEAGLIITAFPAAIVLAAPIAGRLIARVPAGLLGGLGMGLMALALAALALLPAQPAAAADIAWRMALGGLGFGLFQSPNNHTIVTSAPLRRAGAASGMLATARLTGQSAGAVLLGIIFSLRAVGDGGATLALGLAAALAVAAALFSLLRVRAQ